jgi:hypothetical protein
LRAGVISAPTISNPKKLSCSQTPHTNSKIQSRQRRKIKSVSNHQSPQRNQSRLPAAAFNTAHPQRRHDRLPRPRIRQNPCHCACGLISSTPKLRPVRPELYIKKLSTLLYAATVAKPFAQIQNTNPANVEKLKALLATKALDESKVGFLPPLFAPSTRNEDMTVVLDKDTGKILAIAPFVP